MKNEKLIVRMVITTDYNPCTWVSSSLSQYEHASCIPVWETSKLKYSCASSALPRKIFQARATEYGESPSFLQIMLNALSFWGVAGVEPECRWGLSKNEFATIWLTEFASDSNAWAPDTWVHFCEGAGVAGGSVGEQECFFPCNHGSDHELHHSNWTYLVCWAIFLVTLIIVFLWLISWVWSRGWAWVVSWHGQGDCGHSRMLWRECQLTCSHAIPNEGTNLVIEWKRLFTEGLSLFMTLMTLSVQLIFRIWYNKHSHWDTHPKPGAQQSPSSLSHPNQSLTSSEESLQSCTLPWTVVDIVRAIEKRKRTTYPGPVWLDLLWCKKVTFCSEVLCNTCIDRGLKIIVWLTVLTDSLEKTFNEQQFGTTAPSGMAWVAIISSHEEQMKKKWCKHANKCNQTAKCYKIGWCNHIR